MRTPSNLNAIAQEFIDYYTKAGGCSNCGGVPHTTTCFVGRFTAALAAPPQTPQPEMCVCGHTTENHLGCFPRICQIKGCWCGNVEPVKAVVATPESQTAIRAQVEQLRDASNLLNKPTDHIIGYQRALADVLTLCAETPPAHGDCDHGLAYPARVVIGTITSNGHRNDCDLVGYQQGYNAPDVCSCDYDTNCGSSQRMRCISSKC